MRTYLVTGGAGFIGSNFILYMLKTHEDVTVVNVDALTYAGNLENLSDAPNRHIFVKANINDDLTKIFETFKPEKVINFAAESHVDRSINDPGIFVKTNVLGTLNLLNTAKNFGIKKFLQVSTDEVYGALGAEGFFTEHTPLSPHSPYSASKASADLIVKAYYDTYGMPVNITRCSNNYGPYQFPEKLIPLMFNNAKNLKPLPVYGDGSQVRDWLYVTDHCRALEAVLENAPDGEIYNIGGNNERQNIEIVKAVIAYLNKYDANVTERLIEHVPDRPGHDRRYAVDASKIEAELGWRPNIGFEEGIASTLDWYFQNEQWLKNVTGGEYQRYYDKIYKNRR